MSLMRALRAYVGLGPDEDYDGSYLNDLDLPSDDVDVPRDHQGGDESRDGSDAAPDVDLTDESGLFERRRRSEPVTAATSRRRQNAHRSTPTEELARLGFQDEVASETRRSPNRTKAPDPNQTEQKTDNKPGVAVVHSLDAVRAKPKTIVPDSFGHAKSVADEFKVDVPIVLNLQGVERELARRLVDFASGLCYGLDGSMRKIAPQVFLLTPDGIEVTESDLERIRERGYAR